MAPTTRSKRKHQQTELEAEAELRLCARRGNLDRVRELVLIERVNVNSSDEDGRTTLHWAVDFGRANVTRFLLENGANADAADNHGGSTPLGIAILCFNLGLATLLLEYGANVELKFHTSDNSNAFSPLGHAIQRSSVRMVALLLRFGASTEEILTRNSGESFSALLLASLFGDTEIVNFLLDHEGIQINSFTAGSSYHPAQSPMCAACVTNNFEMAHLLIQNGARVIFPGEYPDSPSPLVHAIRRGSLELVRFLLANSPVSASTHRENLETDSIDPLSVPLANALEHNKLESAQLLVDHGANVNHLSLLCACTELEKCEAVRFLLQNGADVNQADIDDDSGKTPLWIAAENGNVTLVQEFLKAGADMNIRDNGGETPLGVAFRKGHKGVVYLLLRTSPQVWSRLENIW